MSQEEQSKYSRREFLRLGWTVGAGLVLPAALHGCGSGGDSAQPLPVETFNGFPQVVWTETRQRVWHPNMTGAGNIVARFAEDDRLELKPYSPNAPW